MAKWIGLGAQLDRIDIRHESQQIGKELLERGT